MIRKRRFLRAIAAGLAAIQIAASGAAPALEALAAAETSQFFNADGDSIHQAPTHAHDASTCPVCRLLDTPAELDVERPHETVAVRHEVATPYTARVVHRQTQTGFLSRAPPTPHS